ncbi:hypothetical protein RRG08_042503 [Elysia crispata]|uniref:Neurotransmitter-gated ion-channel ligand-binding domain-containing protein n=1 Tax=Elysia crispata TaxID=231223 RepID=A0AAE0YDB1_9GAST|nr:hypothetical protein RRG08_042503 [Elysia crispata]
MGRYSPLSILVFFVMEYFYSEVVSQGFSDYNTLTTNLFMNYEKRTRPSTAGSATAVYMIFEPSSIMSLDESEQVLYTYATLKCQWDDDTLSWDPSNYSGITNFLWPQDDVWLPDLVITNSVKDARRLGFKEMPVRVESSGAVAWFPSMILATSCDMDITYYPFDTQKCNIILSTTMSTYEEISILPKGEPISWAEYSSRQPARSNSNPV